MARNLFDRVIEGEMSGYEHHNMTQKEVLDKLYPDYDEHRDWVLWIKPELKYEKGTIKVRGEIELETRDGKIVSHPFIIDKRMSGYGSYIASPFLGSHVSNKYGIPFLFHSYKKLRELQEVHIKWLLIKEEAESKNPENVAAKHLFMCYDLRVRCKYSRQDNRIFTLSCIHTEPDVAFLDEDIDFYDTVLRSYNKLIPQIDCCQIENIDAYASKIHATDKKISEEIKELHDNYIDHIKNVCLGHQENDVMGLVTSFTERYIIPEQKFGPELKYDVHFYETGITLRANNIHVAESDGYVHSGNEEFMCIKNKQTELIRKIHPEYDEENDWVLWIVSDLHYDYRTVHSEPNVKTENRSLVIESAEHEYVNSACGERMKMAYPLVFKSFEELKEIKFVDVEWLLIRKDEESEDAKLFVEYLKVRNHLELKRNKLDPDARIFTIRSEDEIYTNNYVEILKGEVSTMYYNKFDNAYRAEVDAVLNPGIDTGFNSSEPKVFAIRSDYKLDKQKMLDEFKKKYADNMHTATERLEMIRHLEEITKKNGYDGRFHYAAVYQDREIKSIAEWLADVPVE